MAFIRYGKLWRSEFYNNVSAKDRVQDINLNHSKLKMNDTYKEDEKITSFEPHNNEDIVNKAHLDTEISKVKGHISFIEKIFNEFKLRSDKKKQSDDEFVIEKAVKTTFQIIYDKGLFDNYDNADEVIKDYSLVEVNERRRPVFEELNDDNVIR